MKIVMILALSFLADMANAEWVVRFEKSVSLAAFGRPQNTESCDLPQETYAVVSDAQKFREFMLTDGKGIMRAPKTFIRNRGLYGMNDGLIGDLIRAIRDESLMEKFRQDLINSCMLNVGTIADVQWVQARLEEFKAEHGKNVKTWFDELPKRVAADDEVRKEIRAVVQKMVAEELQKTKK